MTTEQQYPPSDVPPPAAPQPPTAPTPPATPPPGYTQPPAAPEPPEHKRSGGLIAGITLIVIGVLFLLAQFVPGLPWWGMWPLIIVAVGVVQAVTPGKDGWGVARLFDGLSTIAWGLLFLAITTGLVGWSVMFTLLTLWPALLIALGFDLLGKALHSEWFRALGSLVIIGALAYAVSVNITGVGGLTWFGGNETTGTKIEISEPVGGTEEASLKLAGGAADVVIGAGDQLIEGEASSPFGGPTFDISRAGNSAELEVTLGGNNGVVMWPGGASAGMDVDLSDAVLWDVLVETGAASVDADLSELDVSSLDLRLGATDVKARLGDATVFGEPSRVEVRAGVSSVNLDFPADAEIRVESQSGLTGHSMGGALESLGGNVWETPGFSEAEERGRPVWVVVIRSGVGSVDIDTY